MKITSYDFIIGNKVYARELLRKELQEKKNLKENKKNAEEVRMQYRDDSQIINIEQEEKKLLETLSREEKIKYYKAKLEFLNNYSKNNFNVNSDKTKQKAK